MSGSPVLEIVEALAEAKSVDPSEVDVLLQDHIEVDAIRHLTEHEDANWTLSFQLPEHEVTVTSDGPILVDGERADAWN